MSIVNTLAKGQIVIPKETRKRYQIEPGSRLLLKEEENRIILIPLPKDPIEELFGSIKFSKSLSKELIKEHAHEKRRET